MIGNRKARMGPPAVLGVMTLLAGCQALPTGGGGGGGPGPPPPPPPPPVVPSQEATWLVVAGDLDSFLFTATAFGVGPRLLATNAHVVALIEEAFYLSSNTVAFVIQHETGDIRDITTVWEHPQFDWDSPVGTPDVGLLEVDEEITGVLTLADDASVRELAVFDNVSLCGFPADVLGLIDFDGITSGHQITAGKLRPRATCLTGTISALRPFDPSLAATPENTQLLQYDLPVAPGTSGSAVFDDRGYVIGINSAGIGGEGDFNFAVRIDTLQELLQRVESGMDQGTLLAEIGTQGGLCSDSCYFAFDGVCDDGGPGAEYALCGYGTDCFDCGVRDETDDWSGGTELCSNTCQWAGDGECDDGGPGAEWVVCDYGTDCADCGPR